MTTGNKYATQFIGLAPDSETRSVIDLLEVEEKHGYGGMTDAEIANLIEYKQHIAAQSEEIEIKRRESEARLEALRSSLAAQAKQIMDEIGAETLVLEKIGDHGEGVEDGTEEQTE